jgi:putative ABC transport system substrate-binding protein
MPGATTVALLVNQDNPGSASVSKNAEAAAAALGLQLRILHAATDEEIEAALADFPRLNAGALTIGTDAFFNERAKLIAALSLRYAVPTIYAYHEFAEAGGLMSYGGSIIDSYHTAGVLAGRILKGDKPADLPVQQSTTVELIINLKTAKTFGLTIPQALLARADEVSE